jgi:hypothetical protein
MASDDEGIENISPHIRIRIKPQKKKEWLEYAEEHHHGNLTDLLKDAVDNTISDNWVLEDKHSPETEIDTSELEEGVTEINDRLSVVERKLDDLTLQSSEDSEPNLGRDDLIKLANRCHDLLPRLQSEVQFPPLQQSLSVQPEDLSSKFEQDIQSERKEDSIHSIRAKMTGRAEDIANAFEKPTHHVRQALIFLEESETGALIESTVDEGVRRWFIRDPDADPEFELLGDHQGETGGTL